MSRVRSLLALLLIFAATALIGTGLLLLFWAPRGNARFDRAVTWWSAIILWAIGVKVTVSGREQAALAGPAVYMVNHQSLLDTPVLFRHVSPSLRFVAKQSLRWVPFMGWAMLLHGFVFIDRQARASAIASLDRACRKIAAGTPVLVFPEGTRERTDGLLPFKKGGFVMALKAQVPIVPMRITGTAALLKRKSLLPRSGPVHLALGRAIPTAGMSVEQRDELMEQVRQAIESLPRGPEA